jgi:hypothetical protein
MLMPIRINKQSFLKSIILAAMVFCPEGSGLFSSGKEGQAKQVFAQMRSHQAMRITIVYDNNPYDLRLRSDWGFSCVINLGERTLAWWSSPVARTPESSTLFAKPKRLSKTGCT